MLMYIYRERATQQIMSITFGVAWPGKNHAKAVHKLTLLRYTVISKEAADVSDVLQRLSSQDWSGVTEERHGLGWAGLGWAGGWAVGMCCRRIEAGQWHQSRGVEA